MLITVNNLSKTNGIKKIVDNVRGLNAFEEETNTVFSKRDKEILLEFPTVYIHNWKNTKN